MHSLLFHILTFRTSLPDVLSVLNILLSYGLLRDPFYPFVLTKNEYFDDWTLSTSTSAVWFLAVPIVFFRLILWVSEQRFEFFIRPPSQESLFFAKKQKQNKKQNKSKKIIHLSILKKHKTTFHQTPKLTGRWKYKWKIPRKSALVFDMY